MIVHEGKGFIGKVLQRKGALEGQASEERRVWQGIRGVASMEAWFQRERQEREFMKKWKGFRRAVLIAFAAAGLICSSVSAKGTDTNYTQVNGQVASGAREKYTKVRGKGKDKVTLMVYMIGSDLETNSGMATSDLNEMVYGGLDNPKLNVIVETGGCRRWRNSVISAKKLQRWDVTGQGIGLLEEKRLAPMTDEEELADFIRFCKKQAPADRYMLVFWDHGGGSVSGFGHDESYPNDTMNIGEISKALKKGGVKFDFIGFDACLMATLETAIAIEPYADYMIASEESEPGTGWYYTNWLRMLNENSSENTLSLGRRICDDFTSKNLMYAATTGTTLSVTDLSELDGIVSKRLAAFGSALTKTIQDKDYISVAKARNGSREFARASRLDQIDLVDFCNRLGSAQSKELADAVRSAVKYNRVNNVSNAYGLSVYFPNSSLKSVNSMISLCTDIGVDSGWTDGLRTYAAVEQSGQIAASSAQSWGNSSGSLIDILLGSGGSGNGSYDSSQAPSLLEALFGSAGDLDTDSYSTYDSYGSMSESDLLGILSQAGYGSSYGGQGGYGSSYGSGGSYGYGDSYDPYGYGSYGGAYAPSSGSLLDILTGGYASTDGQYYGANNYSSVLPYEEQEDSSIGGSLLSLAADLLFSRAPVSSSMLELTGKDGENVLELDEEMWDQIVDAQLEVFVDDGGGYLDLGLDNVLSYNEDGDLIDAWDGTWVTLNGQAAAVYPISDEDEDGNGLYITRKFIPALLNGERINLIVEFNEETGEDTVLGAEKVLATGVQEKGYTPLNGGDIIQLICDYFTYEGAFEGSYQLGDPFLVPEDGHLTVANRKIAGGERMLYTVRLTDIYQAHYWLPLLET